MPRAAPLRPVSRPATLHQPLPRPSRTLAETPWSSPDPPPADRSPAGCPLDGSADSSVSATAADVARHRGVDVGIGGARVFRQQGGGRQDRKSTRLNSSHGYISYAVFCLKKKKTKQEMCISV